ncbi:MAG: hypothetical protein KatS3mg059_0507 [Thermomicrobiales bacterium]|nr:MAG: hypothetical protein KatS3mg059_0507 [Thermomicrobiales bacterium]
MSLTDNAIAAQPEASLASIVVRCMGCGARVPADRPITQCPACGDLLDIELAFPAPLDRQRLGEGVPRRLRASGVWRYASLLPALPHEAIITRAEGNTPVYWDERLARYAGLDQLGLKHEGHNPTASFKDRGMTVGISHAVAVGARVVACASTGNTSASLASYAAAAAGLTALVVIPEGKDRRRQAGADHRPRRPHRSGAGRFRRCPALAPPAHRALSQSIWSTP